MEKENTSIQYYPSFRFIHFASMSLFCVLLFACSGKKNQPDLSAIPHAEALPAAELSEEDKEKLLEAEGKTLETISVKDFQNMLDASDGSLYLYVLWNSKCSSCLETIKGLKANYINSMPEKLKIITINLADTPKNANLFLRSENIVFESYQLKAKGADWTKSIDEDWDGGLPAMFMINKSEDLFLKYYKSMNINEIEAILQTLII